jgi:hypothetical protein
MAAPFLAPLFCVLGLSASSFRFRNLTGLTPPAPPTTAAPSGHLPFNRSRNIPTASSQPIATHNVLCALRIASRPCGRASHPERHPLPGLPSAPSLSPLLGKATSTPRRRSRSLLPGMTHPWRGLVPEQGRQLPVDEWRPLALHRSMRSCRTNVCDCKIGMRRNSTRSTMFSSSRYVDRSHLHPADITTFSLGWGTCVHIRRPLS